MKKLTLNLDALRIESFNTSPAIRQHGGTVNAYRHTAHDALTCGFMQSCEIFCESDDCPTRGIETCAVC